MTDRTAFSPEEIRSADCAEALFRTGATCSQAVVLSQAERLALPKELCANLTLGLGGGVARTRQICGCVSGYAFLAGISYGSGLAFSSEAKATTYACVQDFIARFKAEFHSTTCGELLALRAESAKSASDNAATPSGRTQEYYHHRAGCIQCIRFAASLATRLPAPPKQL
ncbi:MAG: C-GCAxxG-C-C family protein [Kiritimatiellia bacterium]